MGCDVAISASLSAPGVLGTADGTSIHVKANICADEGKQVKQSMSVFSPFLLHIYLPKKKKKSQTKTHPSERKTNLQRENHKPLL